MRNEFMLLSLQKQVTCHLLHITQLTGRQVDRKTGGLNELAPCISQLVTCNLIGKSVNW